MDPAAPSLVGYVLLRVAGVAFRVSGTCTGPGVPGRESWTPVLPQGRAQGSWAGRGAGSQRSTPAPSRSCPLPLAIPFTSPFPLGTLSRRHSNTVSQWAPWGGTGEPTDVSSASHVAPLFWGPILEQSHLSCHSAPCHPPHLPVLEKPVRQEAAPRIPALGHWTHVAMTSQFRATVPQATTKIVTCRDVRGHRVSLWVLPRPEEPRDRARPEGPNRGPNGLTLGVPESCRGGLLGSSNVAINTVFCPRFGAGAGPSRSRGQGSRVEVRVRRPALRGCPAAGLSGPGSGGGCCVGPSAR